MHCYMGGFASHFRDRAWGVGYSSERKEVMAREPLTLSYTHPSLCNHFNKEEK